MFKKLTDIFSIAKKAIKSVIGKVLKTPEMPTAPAPKVEKKSTPVLPEIESEEAQEQKPGESTEEELAQDTIDSLIDKIKEMDESGYTPYSPHEWSINPDKAINSNGAGIAKEDSGNAIIDLIRSAVADVGSVTVARSLEQYWDGILYQIERLEFAIYDAEYRKRSGGRAAYESAMLKLEGMLKIGSDEEVEGKYI